MTEKIIVDGEEIECYTMDEARKLIRVSKEQMRKIVESGKIKNVLNVGIGEKNYRWRLPLDFRDYLKMEDYVED